MILLPTGLVLGGYIVTAKLMGMPISTNYPLLDVLMLLSGLQFLLFAMFFDMQECNKDMRGINKPYYEY